MTYTDRIDGYQIQDPTYIGLPPEGTPPTYDIVKWVEEAEPFEVIDMKTGERKTATGYCYTVATLDWDRSEGAFELYSVGLRWLEERPSEAVIEMILRFAEEKGRELDCE